MNWQKVSRARSGPSIALPHEPAFSCRAVRGFRVWSDFVSKNPRILYCHCAWAQVVPAEVKNAVLRQLCDSGEAFETVADLCEISARRDPVLKRLAKDGPLKIAACYPRAVKWLFAAADAPLSEENTEILNMRCESADAIHAALTDPRISPSTAPEEKHGEPARSGPPNQANATPNSET